MPSAWAFLMNSMVRSVTSSSMVSMRFLVSGPVSSMRPSAKEWITPRGRGSSSGGRSCGIVRVFRLLLGVEVIEVAVELVKAVIARQELVLVAQVVLAELAGDIAVRLEQFGDGRVFGLQAEFGARHTHLGQPGADWVLAGDKGCPPCGAALLGVVVGEFDPFSGDAVDVGRLVAHRTAVVVADVVPANVVSPQDQDVRFSVGHCVPSLGCLGVAFWRLPHVIAVGDDRRWTMDGCSCVVGHCSSFGCTGARGRPAPVLRRFRFRSGRCQPWH